MHKKIFDPSDISTLSFNHDVVSEIPARRAFDFLTSCAGGLVVALYIGISGTAQTALLVFGALGICGAAALVSMSRCARAHSALQQDHRRLRAEWEEQAKLLQEALDAKTNFLAAASHDLRQPAQALALFVDELQRAPPSTDQGRLVTRIKAASDNLIAALGALTDIAKLDGLGIEPRTESVDLRELVERICAIFQSAADIKGVQLSYEGVDVHVASDPSILHGILSNLVANAVKYTDRGSVQVYGLSNGTSIEVSVQDTGRGISEKDRPRIYDEFFRGSNASASESGMGLGLAIVRRLAHAARIRIRLESAIGVGSRFVLELALVPPPEPAFLSAEVLRKQQTQPVDDPLTGLHIVVLENDPVVARTLQEVLEKWGAVVHSVLSTEAMLQLLHAGNQPVDVLIVDHHLGPSSNGFQAIDALRGLMSDAVHIAVLMMTGDLDPKISRMAARRGIALIHKPIPPSRLKAAMVDLLKFDAPFDNFKSSVTSHDLLETGEPGR